MTGRVVSSNRKIGPFRSYSCAIGAVGFHCVAHALFIVEAVGR